MKGVADPRPDAARELGIPGLKPDGSAHAARPNSLQRNNEAADERHPAAMQRVCLDRIDLPQRPPARERIKPKAEKEPTDERHRNRDGRIELGLPREALS